MDYLYENLGDERFQELCQALIAKDFNDSQAFPVGQPDGGRDMVVRILENKNKDFLVFQVKYVRNPFQIHDPHKWLIKIMQEEIDKVKKLTLKGASKYYLITNVKGTAHLGNGSIDTLNKLLQDNMPIPSMCWWRDDISRRLEANPLLKWSFSEIFNGQDILNSIIFQSANERKEKQQNVIKAYLRDQYEMDNEVKFKQIELQNRLLDLFTDVPIRIKKFNDKNKVLRNLISHTRFRNHVYLSNDDFIKHEESSNVGAAQFLLDQKTQSLINKVLLE